MIRIIHDDHYYHVSLTGGEGGEFIPEEGGDGFITTARSQTSETSTTEGPLVPVPQPRAQLPQTPPPSMQKTIPLVVAVAA